MLINNFINLGSNRHNSAGALVAPMRARIVLRRALTTSAQRYLHEREAAQTFPGVMCITLATTQWRRGPGVQTRWGLIRR